MSYEGYQQLLCKNGHLMNIDAYENAPFRCPDCNEPIVWWNGVDETNGMCEMTCPSPRNETLSGLCDSCEERIDGYVQLEVDVPAVIEQCNLGCNHIMKSTRYKIPTDKGHLLEED